MEDDENYRVEDEFEDYQYNNEQENENEDLNK